LIGRGKSPSFIQRYRVFLMLEGSPVNSKSAFHPTISSESSFGILFCPF
jgi:hypothetical protein